MLDFFLIGKVITIKYPDLNILREFIFALFSIIIYLSGELFNFDIQLLLEFQVLFQLPLFLNLREKQQIENFTFGFFWMHCEDALEFHGRIGRLSRKTSYGI